MIANIKLHDNKYHKKITADKNKIKKKYIFACTLKKDDKTNSIYENDEKQYSYLVKNNITALYQKC